MFRVIGGDYHFFEVGQEVKMIKEPYEKNDSIMGLVIVGEFESTDGLVQIVKMEDVENVG